MNDIDICFPGPFIAVLKLDFFKKFRKFTVEKYFREIIVAFLGTL